MNKTDLRQALISWYESQKRPLPWRKTTDPYHIWLSEIILQQTRINQGLPYYQRFVENYATVQELAAAPLDNILKDWEGLGYYSRARNLHTAAQQVVDDWQGHFPENFTDLLKLKGVGEYTAAAISSFAYNEAQAVLDGNVFRVLSRLYAEDTPINTSAGKKLFAKLAQSLLDKGNPATYNQAIMEFGALQCVPKSPNCGVCPLNSHCQAFVEERVSDFPEKNKKQYNRERFFNYLVLNNEKKVAIGQRHSGIWQGLYQFPLIETSQEMESKHFLESPELKQWVQGVFEVEGLEVLPPHKLSHQTLFINIYKINTGKAPVLPEGYTWQLWRDVKRLAFPRPLARYLNEKQLPLHLI